MFIEDFKKTEIHINTKEINVGDLLRITKEDGKYVKELFYLIQDSNIIIKTIKNLEILY